MATFFCCGSFNDVQNPPPAPPKKSLKAIPTTSIRGSLVRLYDTDIEETFYLDRDHELGKGGCGVVVIGEHKDTHVQYAIKIVNKSTAERGRLDREIKLLKDVDHANIVRLFSVYESSAYMYFVMELCLGGHLGNLIARQPNKYLDEDWARRLCRQIFSAVSHIHSRGIAHRDIKLQNILIDCNNDRIAQIKLIDFGYGSRYIGNLPMKTKCGTPYTTAPEVIRENYDERCDVWSVGVVLYIMLCGRRPFEALDIGGPLTDAGKAAMITNILAGRYHFNHRPWQNVSRSGINFVKTLLNHDYRTRIRSNEALENSWLIDPINKSLKTSPLLSAKSFRAVSKLKQSQDQTHMQRTGMMAVVFGLNSRTSIDLRAVFQSFDTDLSGAISRKEFHTAMEELAPELIEDDIDKLFNLIDIDKNQQLSFTEFLIATLDPREIDIEELNNAFRILDEDGNGFITKDELRKIIRSQLIQAMENDNRNENGEMIRIIQPAEIGQLYSEVEQRIDEIFASVDVNNDGRISRAEFLWAMTGSTEFLPRSVSSINNNNNNNSESIRLQKHRSVRGGGSGRPDPPPQMNKRAASTSNLPIAGENNQKVSTLESSSKKAHIDQAHSPPNFRGILARNQFQQMETNLTIKHDSSPRTSLPRDGSIAHYDTIEHLEPIRQPEEHPEDENHSSTSSYDADKVAKLFGRPTSINLQNTEPSYDSRPVSLNLLTRQLTLTDRDNFYRMSEVEEEKSEFDLSHPRNLPPINFRNSTIIDSSDMGNTVKMLVESDLNKSGPPTFRAKLGSGKHPSFKRDISQKFIDIATLDTESKSEMEPAPMLGVSSRNFSMTSLINRKFEE